MSDGQLLLIFLIAFTLYECVRWVPARAWIFQAVGGGKWKASRPWEVFRTRGGGMKLLMPIPPVEPHVVTASWPCVPHEAGLCLWEDESGTARHVPWDQVRAIAEGAVLHLNPQYRVRCIHAQSANAWAAEVNTWVKQTQVQRRKAFLKRTADMFNSKSLTEEAASVQLKTRGLRRLGSFIFFWCFLFLPFIYWRWADAWPSLAAIGVLFVLTFIQGFLLFRHVRRDSRLKADAIQHVLSTTLFPPAAMRAADWVCSACSPEAHPLAALRTWGKPEAVTELAATLWREARWPRGDHFAERPWHGPEVEALERFFKSAGIALETLEAAPALPEGCTRWCPRCQTPYQDTVSECADCGGMKLLVASDS